MIDSHSHILKEYYENIDEIINNSKMNNIVGIVNCADGIDSSKEVLELSKKHSEYIFPAIGIHPENVNELDKIDELEELIIKNNIYAIGEIGLDYHYNKENKEKQKLLFNKQLDLANKYNLPVIVHTRESIQDTFDILKNKKIKGVIHCYSGSYEMAKEFIKLGYKLGIGGILTFKNSKLYELIKKISIEDILIETDCPFLSPEPLRGTKNLPQNVFYVAKKISEIKNISVEEVISITTNNTRNLFNISL